MTAATALTGGRLKHSWLPAWVTQYLLWAGGLVLIVGPIIPVIWASLWSTPLYEAGGSLTLGNYQTLLSDPAWWEAVRNSVIFAVLTTVGSVVLGTAMAVLFTRTDLPCQRFFRSALLIPVVIPGLPLLLGWTSMYAPAGYVTRWVEEHTPLPIFWDLYTVPGMSLVAIGIAAPVVYLFARGALASQDSSLEMAARSAGASPLRTLRTVTIPLVRPALLNSSMIVFALSLEVLGLPLILGTSSNIQFVSTYLYDNWLNVVPSQQGLVSAGAVVLLAAVTVLLLVRNRLTGDVARFHTVGGKSTSAATVKLGGARWPLFAVTAGYFTAVIVIPHRRPAADRLHHHAHAVHQPVERPVHHALPDGARRPGVHAVDHQQPDHRHRGRCRSPPSPSPPWRSSPTARRSATGPRSST